MKENYLKSMLLATMMVVGATSSYAQTTTTIYEKASISAWTAGDVSATATADKWTPSASSGSNWGTFIVDTLGLKTLARRNTVESALTLTRDANTIVTLDAVWNTGSSSFPSNENKTYFKYGDFTITNLTRYYGTSIVINGQTINLSNVANNTDVILHLVVNSTTGAITEATGVLADGTSLFDMTTLGANTTFVSGTNYETVVCGSVCTVSKNTTESYLKSIEVQQTTQNVATADYTVNFATADGNIVKTETRNGVVNSDIALSSADTQAFFDANDATKKYLYVSDDCTGKTVEDNATGTTIVTVTVRPAELWTYTVTTSYNGNALPYRFTGETWEDVPTVKVAYPRFQAAGENENILVEKTPNSNDLLQSITLTSTDYNENFDYTATGIENLYLLSEAENLGTGLSANATSFTSRVSNGLIIFGASGTLVKLPAGNFKFTLGMIGGDSSNHIVNYTVSAGANEILDTQCTGNMLRLATSDVFTLTDSTDITFTCSDPSSSRGIDMIYVEKLAAPTVNINATSNLASYSNQYAVTVPDDVTIYIASAADATDGITLNKVNSKVIPANTGVILYSATTGDKTLTYGGTATSTDFSGNLLLATNDATVASDGTQYVLLKGEQSFAQVVAGVEIPANKAYVTIAGSPAKLAVNMGEATAINAVKTADNAAEDVFNLAGQKVTNSYKGIVIKGGKKYIAR